MNRMYNMRILYIYFKKLFENIYRAISILPAFNWFVFSLFGDGCVEPFLFRSDNKIMLTSTDEHVGWQFLSDMERRR